MLPPCMQDLEESFFYSKASPTNHLQHTAQCLPGCRAQSKLSSLLHQQQVFAQWTSISFVIARTEE